MWLSSERRDMDEIQAEVNMQACSAQTVWADACVQVLIFCILLVYFYPSCIRKHLVSESTKLDVGLSSFTIHIHSNFPSLQTDDSELTTPSPSPASKYFIASSQSHSFFRDTTHDDPALHFPTVNKTRTVNSARVISLLR